ncbi:MAG: N-6 DNA methylase, partial [Planctomycetota bacterium]
EEYCCGVSKEHRKKLGQFFTPPNVARFMATPGHRLPRRVLDPAAGTGVLLCALIDRLAEGQRPVDLHADAYEVDPALVPLLRQALAYARNLLPAFSFTIHEEDFIESWAARSGSLFPARSSRYDLVVANPPYFKVRADSRVASVARAFGAQGCTNIYSLMMAAAADLLNPEGEMVFIVPRSFCNGSYFARFRRQLLGNVSLERAHVFGSRRAAFRAYGVLQENVIVWLARKPQSDFVVVSSSDGVADLANPCTKSFVSTDVISDGLAIQLPTSDSDKAVLRKVGTWPCRLRSLGLEISTGPIVAYRSTEWLERGRGDCPLLLLDNVRLMRIDWPRENGKPQYVRRCTAAEKWLVPNANYVLLRRFSAKEDTRRLQAAASLASRFEADWLGLENHLNFIHRPGGALSEDEALGLAAVLNSELLDSYFRIINGNTQVNATDIRALPLPPLHVVSELGAAIQAGASWSAAAEQALVGAYEEVRQEASGV